MRPSILNNFLLYLKRRFLCPKKRPVFNTSYWNVDIFEELLPKIYVYDLPSEFKPTCELPLVSETYFAIHDFIRLYCRTDNPHDADFFFIPLNLIEFQFRNENPVDVLKHLRYLKPDRSDHLLVALGDFSQRSKKNHFGHAYLKTYTWLDNIILLALESTSDLIPYQDIGIIPYNTLSQKLSIINTNKRLYLYSFLGGLNHPHLPDYHIRCRIRQLRSCPDVFIGESLSKSEISKLRSYYFTENDYELVSRNSVFTLAPAGYGRWTYRFFQSLQWGSIPVLLSDDYSKPFDDTIPYDDFCVTIKENDFDKLDEILRSYTLDDISRFQSSINSNLHHFTQEAFFRKVCNILLSRNKS